MSGKAPNRRRLRIRRKGWHEDLAETAIDVAATDVVAEFGCCFIEAIAAASILVAMIAVPAHLLLC